MGEAVTCKQCDGEMERTKKVDKSLGKQLIGVALFIIGVTLLWVVPLGTILGLILMAYSLGLGYDQTKVWMCKKCGYFYERGK